MRYRTPNINSRHFRYKTSKTNVNRSVRDWKGGGSSFPRFILYPCSLRSWILEYFLKNHDWLFLHLSEFTDHKYR